MLSKRNLEGYLMVDHRATNEPGMFRGMFEAAVITCSHCQRQMIRNPARTRERAWCWGCDSYICDTCGIARTATGECKTFKQVMDEFEAKIIKEQANG